MERVGDVLETIAAIKGKDYAELVLFAAGAEGMEEVLRSINAPEVVIWGHDRVMRRMLLFSAGKCGIDLTGKTLEDFVRDAMAVVECA